MGGGVIIKNRRGQGTVENLMMTAIIAGLLLPIVYNYALKPLLNMMQGQKKGLVSFVAQDTKKTVPSAWFASERLAQFKDPKNIEAPKDIKTDDIPQPGEVPPPKDIQDPKEIKTKPVNNPKDIKEPRAIKPPGDIRPGGGGGSGGAGGAGSAMGSSAQDPDFFGGGNKPQDGNPNGDFAPGDGGVGRGSVSGGGGDEYSPKGKNGANGGSETNRGKSEAGRKDETGAEKRAKQNLVLNEAREEERSRSSPFDWWLLIKVLILGLIIFLFILIGLSNMKKR